MPPQESKERSHYWLLLTAAYGLVNASAKWQANIDGSFMDIGFKQLVYIPQLFYMKDKNDELRVLAVKVVDDVLLAAEEKDLRNVLDKISSMYQVGTIVYGPGTFWFNGLSVKKEDDYSISVDADAKLKSVDNYPITCYRRKEIGGDATPIEISAFRSTNGQLGWIGTAASPLCAHASSYLQQKVSESYRESNQLCERTEEIRDVHKVQEARRKGYLQVDSSCVFGCKSVECMWKNWVCFRTSIW